MSKQPQTQRAFLIQVLILLFVATVVTWSMWQAPGLLAGHSARKDLARLVEFDAAIRGGDFFPSWSPDLYAGYGSPIFQFYSPLAYYIAEIPVLLGFNYATAFKVTWVLTLCASGLAMYYLGSAYLSRWAACLGGVFYMVAPYRLVDMFIRHALAEHCAFIWLPLIVGSTARFATSLSPMGFVMGAVAIAALILTHNVMALIGLPLCLAAALALALSNRNGVLTPVASYSGREKEARINPKGPRRSNRVLQYSPIARVESRSKHFGTDDGRSKLAIMSFARTGTVAVVGIGLAAFFWWPAMSGRALTYAEPSLTGGYYDFHRHFVQGWQFFDTHWNFGISGGDTGKAIPLQFGLPHLLAALGALAMVLTGWQGKGEAGRMRLVWSAVGLCVVAIGIFMCCRWSQPLWQWVPLLKYVQFPWRFLGLVVFGSTMCATALGDRVADLTWHSQEERSPPHKVLTQRLLTDKGGPVVMALLIAGIMAVYFPYYSQAFFFTGDARTRSVVRVTAAEVQAMQSTGVLIPFGLSMSGAQLRVINERATSGDDFLPRDVKEKPSHPPTEIVQAKGGRVIEVAGPHQNYYRSRVEMLAAGKVELLQFWFPGWQASVDGSPVRTAPSGPQAIVSCDLPSGDHVVEFIYRNRPQRSIGIILSIISAAIGACAVVFFRQRLHKGQRIGNC